MLFKLSRLHPWVRGDRNNIRYLPVNADIDRPESFPMPVELLYRLIEEASHRVIVEYCICRKACGCEKHSSETGCIVLVDSAMEIAPSVRREVDVEEAKEHARRGVIDGLIPFVGKIRMDNLLYGVRDRAKLLTVCFCCECCCAARFTKHIPIANLEPAYARL